MPVIAFANSKGGTGKTTSALLLACELAESKPVTVIDADPRRPISKWAGQHPHQIAAGKLDAEAEKHRLSIAAKLPTRLSVITSGGEDTILDEIEEAANTSTFVIIDLEGVASKLVSYAMSQADFVIVPMQESKQDADEALVIIKEIHRNMQATRRKIPYSVLFTRTKWVKARTARNIGRQFRENKHIDTFDVEIFERDAFSAIFELNGSVRTLAASQVNNLDRAIENLTVYKNEVVAKLRALRDTDNERQVA